MTTPTPFVVTYVLRGLRMRAEFRTHAEALRAAADLRINRRIRQIAVHLEARRS